jgi:hypothetical protein
MITLVTTIYALPHEEAARLTLYYAVGTRNPEKTLPNTQVDLFPERRYGLNALFAYAPWLALYPETETHHLIILTANPLLIAHFVEVIRRERLAPDAFEYLIVTEQDQVLRLTYDIHGEPSQRDPIIDRYLPLLGPNL